MKVIINPDKNVVERIKNRIKLNNGHCPCMAEMNEDTKCPCKKFREEKECCCSLYLKITD